MQWEEFFGWIYCFGEHQIEIQSPTWFASDKVFITMSAMSAMWRAKMSAKAIERISPTGANPEEAILCPWFNSSEWEQVYEWLYSSDPQLVKQGIARVAAWKARAPRKLPLVVETTADLAECTLNERLSKMCVAHGICLSYSMAITRCVVGVI